MNSSPSAATSARSCCSLRECPHGCAGRPCDEETTDEEGDPDCVDAARGPCRAVRARGRTVGQSCSSPGAPNRTCSTSGSVPTGANYVDRLDGCRWKSAAPSAPIPKRWKTELLCPATTIAGFEINAGGGDDSAIISPKVLVPVTLRGGPGDDRLCRRWCLRQADRRPRRRHSGRPRRRRLDLRRPRERPPLRRQRQRPPARRPGRRRNRRRHRRPTRSCSERFRRTARPGAGARAGRRRRTAATIAKPTSESAASSRKPAWTPSTKGGIAAEKTVVVRPSPIEPPAIWNM